MNQVDAAWRERVYSEAKAKTPKRMFVNIPSTISNMPSFGPKLQTSYEASFPPSPGGYDHCGSPVAKGRSPRSQSARRLPRTADDYYSDVIRRPESPGTPGSNYADSPRRYNMRSPKSEYSESSFGTRSSLKQLRDEVNVVKKQLELERMERDRLQFKVAELERGAMSPVNGSGGGYRPRARTARGGGGGNGSLWGRDPAYKARDLTDTIRDQTSTWKEQLRHKPPEFYYK